MLPFEDKLPFESLPFEEEEVATRPKIPTAPGDVQMENVPTKKKLTQEEMNAAVVGGIKGIGETALSLGTGILAPVLAPASMAGRGIMNKILPDKVAPSRSYGDTIDDLTYAPKGEVGSKYVGSIGAALQAFPPVGAYVNAPGLIRQARGRPGSINEPAPIPPKAVEQPKTLVENLPQEVRDQQAFLNRLPFEEEAPSRGDMSTQESLPFTSSVEDVAASRAAGSPQIDMFVQENALQKSFDPYQEALQKQADQEQMNLLKAAEEGRKQQEIDDAFVQRQEQLKQQELFAKQDEVTRRLDEMQWKMEEQQRPSIHRRNELGAIDVKAVQEAIGKFKAGQATQGDLLHSFKGTFTDNEMARVYAAINDSNGRETVTFISPSQFHSLARGRTPADIAQWGPKLYPEINQGLDSKGGLWDMPFLRVGKDGVVQAHEGRHRMDIFKDRGVELVPVRLRADGFKWNEHTPTKLFAEDSKDVSPQLRELFSQPIPAIMSRKANEKKYLMNGQRGVLDINAMSEAFSKLGKIGKDDPGVIAAGKEIAKDNTRAVVYDIPGLEPFRPTFNSPEKVLAVLDDPRYKDLSATQKFIAKTVKPGIRTVRVSNNNPLVAFAETAISRATNAAENDARVFITNKDAIGPIWQKLKKDERVQIHRLLKQGDTEMRNFTPEELAEAGYTPKQIAFMEKYYAMEKHKLDVMNEARLEVGMEPVKPRPGHFPGLFTGDFYSLAIEDGKVVGFVGTNTRWGNKKVREEMLKQHPNVTFTDVKRRGLGGSYRRSDLLQGMSEIMQFLGSKDPKIKDIQSAIQGISDQSANAWMGADLRAMNKKGIWGNEGNKPWNKDAYAASDEAMKSYFTSWEEEMLSHHALPVNSQLTALATNPEVQAKYPNAIDYVNKYTKHMTGTYTTQLGATLNNILDMGMQGVSFGQLGPSSVRALTNQFTKRMGQWTQGFGNIPYTAMQLLQPGMTAVPEMYKAGNTPQISMAMSQGIADSIKYLRKLVDNNYKPDGETAAMFDYAESKGLLTFSEYDDVSKITQSKGGKAFDTAVDFNRQLGEQSTRPYVFFSFVNLLKNTDIPKSEIFDTAYNMTQYSMTDYHPRERALMYRDLGVVGQLAGSLSQFKHSYINQMAQWVKPTELIKTPQAAIAGLTAVAVLAGYRGLPGYEDLDETVKYLTNKFGDKKTNIAELIAANGPEWLSMEPVAYGLMSSESGVNVSSRLGMAQVAPQSLIESLSPYAGKAVRLGEAAVETAKGANPRAPLNLGMELAPSSIRGLLEDKLSTSEDGMLINKKGQNEYKRTEFDRKVKRFGLTSLEESKNRENVYLGTERKMSDTERRSKLTGEAAMKFNQLGKEWMKSQEFQEIKAEYIKRGGDPDTLINSIVSGKVDAIKTGKQRAEGEPNTYQGIKRYEYYNK